MVLPSLHPNYLNQDFHFGPSTVTVYTRAAAKGKEGTKEYGREGGDGSRPRCSCDSALEAFRRKGSPRYRETSGEGLTVQALIAIGWPGEKIKQSAAENRVWVTLATLRKLGFKEHLEKDDRGYYLLPALTIQRSPATLKEILAQQS